MEMLLDAMAQMPDALTKQGPSNDGAALRAVNSDLTGVRSVKDNEQLHPIGPVDTPTRKRHRQLSEAPAIHQCHICQRTYERADRLSRHLKSHENARRYLCQRCQKSFNRADLLTRHRLTHNRKQSGDGSGSVGINRTDRAGQACIACATAKARCEDNKPCRRCQTKDITCEVASQVLHGPQRQMSTSPHLHDNNAPANEQQINAFIADENHHRNSRVNQHTSRHGATDRGLAHPASTKPTVAPMDVFDMQSVPIGGSQPVYNNDASEILFVSNAADFNLQDTDINFYDFTFQDEPWDVFPTPLMYRHTDEPAIVQATGDLPRPTRDVRAGYAAFTRSPWLWTPAQRDHALRDAENLPLDEDSLTSALTPKSSGLTPKAPSCGFPIISPALRDKMYYLISTMNKYTTRIPSFPSTEFINQLLESFYIRHMYQVDNWIHVPSMKLSEIIPELGLALVVASSTLVSVPAVLKIGLVLQDVLRIKLGELWERDNRATRKLEPLQAWMLTLDAGLFSGFQRQMELAESFGQTLITMMRRGGMFGTTTDTQELTPHESDTGQVLEAKWKKWSLRESFKRLAIHLFLHDTRASIALQKHPLISVTEITVSLPASKIKFLAGSATEWKSCFHEKRVPLGKNSPQLTDAMHDISILDDLHSEVDVSLCYTAVIHGFWCQIWAFRESWKFHGIGDNSDSVHRLWLVAQQRELYQQVEAIGKNLLSMRVLQSELFVIVELLLMILNISPEELQRFAGRYGEEAASQVFPSMERWSRTEQARRTVWHAGQVFRWASLMPSAELRDIYAIAVYFASLALWTFGHLLSSRDTINASKTENNHSPSEANSNCNFAILNGEECFSSRSFISGRQITPILTMTSEISFKDLRGSNDETRVRLDNPNAVLQIARDMYRRNFLIEAKPLPPLVENMGNLMRDLGCLPDNRFSRGVSPVDRNGYP